MKKLMIGFSVIALGIGGLGPAQAHTPLGVDEWIQTSPDSPGRPIARSPGGDGPDLAVARESARQP